MMSLTRSITGYVEIVTKAPGYRSKREESMNVFGKRLFTRLSTLLWQILFTVLNCHN